MNCPTCDHLMTHMGYGVNWCCQCGTIKTGLSKVASEPNLRRYCNDLRHGLSKSPEGRVLLMAANVPAEAGQ